jgi:hypothetical protein
LTLKAKIQEKMLKSTIVFILGELVVKYEEMPYHEIWLKSEIQNSHLAAVFGLRKANLYVDHNADYMISVVVIILSGNINQVEDVPYG